MLRTILTLACSVGVAGCLTSNVLVTVRPDGTGTIEHTTTLRPSAMAQLEKLLAPEITDPSVPGAASGRLSGQTLTAPQDSPTAPQNSSAWRWGRSVRMRSTRPLNGTDSVGWKTIYDFDDVTSLGVDLMPFTPGLRAFYSVAAKEKERRAAALLSGRAYLPIVTTRVLLLLPGVGSGVGGLLADATEAVLETAPLLPWIRT